MHDWPSQSIPSSILIVVILIRETVQTCKTMGIYFQLELLDLVSESAYSICLVHVTMGTTTFSLSMRLEHSSSKAEQISGFSLV